MVVAVEMHNKNIHRDKCINVKHLQRCLKTLCQPDT